MNTKEKRAMAEVISDFRITIKDFSLSQLKQMQEEIQNSISKMILDSDLILKASIIEQAIIEKEKQQN